MLSQVRVFVGFNTDVSLFEPNLAFIRMLSINFEVNSNFDIPDLTLVSSTKK